MEDFAMAMGIMSPFFLLFGALRAILSHKPNAGFRSIYVGIVMAVIFFLYGPTQL